MDSELPVSVKAAPSPKSPPKYPDFCGRRRLQLEVQVLNREIGFLEEELQSLEGLQPVSICCKEVEEFVGSKADPLIAIDKKRQNSCYIWKWLRSFFCFPISLLCCCGGCPKSACCVPRKNCRSCSCSCGCRCKEHCPICTCGCGPICTSFHLPSCLAIRRSCSSCCPCACGLSCCRLPRCRCSRCCCSRPAELACCVLPQCPASCWDLSSCMPWRWSCGRWCWCCSCRGFSCSFPTPTCPICSCGCIWSCSKCAQAGPCCRTCGYPNSSCSSGCLC